MDLLHNPFHILTATPYDNRSRIMELANERSLLLDPDKCMAACSNLTHPRNRISSEVAWLPGIGPERASEISSLIGGSLSSLLAISNLTPIARTNVQAAAIARLPKINANNITKWIHEIAQTFEDIDLEDLSVLINEDRIVAGFPQITDISNIETEIKERRRYYGNVIKWVLNKLTPEDRVKVITNIVESATDIGEKYCPRLIVDLVNSFESSADIRLQKEADNIKSLVKILREAIDAKHSDSFLTPMVKQLIKTVKDWDIIAQPIQVAAKSQGLKHDLSHDVAEVVRDLAIHIFNEHGKLEYSQQLIKMLQDVFAEVGEIAEYTAEDADTLNDLAEQRARWTENAKIREEEWRKKITYEADIGLIFKDKLRISPDGIEWKGRFWNLDSITRVRWGGTKLYVNGSPAGTSYSIFFGNSFSCASIQLKRESIYINFIDNLWKYVCVNILGDSPNYASLELKRESIYNNFIDRLWKSVCVRLLTEYLEGLRDGKKYLFGSYIINDYGIEFERKKFIFGNEKIFCQWKDLEIWNEPGMFCLGKKGDEKLRATFSYLNEDNIHILEAAIRNFWKKGAGDKISSLLEIGREIEKSDDESLNLEGLDFDSIDKADAQKLAEMLYSAVTASRSKFPSGDLGFDTIDTEDAQRLLSAFYCGIDAREQIKKSDFYLDCIDKLDAFKIVNAVYKALYG